MQRIHDRALFRSSWGAAEWWGLSMQSSAAISQGT
jgi:hypothetical protein